MASSRLNNRYQILDTLGHGGFGCTYLAEDTHLPSRRRCVIKQLKLTTQTEAKRSVIQQRFEREAAVLETLGQQHPQIPELHAYFCENGQFWCKSGLNHLNQLKMNPLKSLSKTVISMSLPNPLPNRLPNRK